MIRSVTGGALTALLGTSPSAAIDAASMAGIWFFDEGEGDVAVDRSGNDNEGVLTGGVDWVDGADAVFGSALEFDGSGFVAIADADSLDMEEAMTITFWVRSEKAMLDMWGDRQAVVGKHYVEYEVGIYLDAQLHTYSSDLAADYDEGIMATFNGKHPNGDAEWEEGTWYHVAWTLDGQHEMAWVDGVLIGEYDKAHEGTLPGTHMLEIGRRGEGGIPVTGAVDDVGIFNVALEEDDILMIFERGLGQATGISPVEPAGKLTSTWGAL
ncbi:MAG: LamG domain-containing protein, partial [Candidatus Poribacteria bacterium]